MQIFEVVVEQPVAGGVTVEGLDAHQAYPVKIRPKNRFGYGASTRLFILQFPSDGKRC